MTSNPIFDAWMAAWTTGLNLTTQMSGQWLNQAGAGGMGHGRHQPMTNPWAAWMPQAQANNPWMALSGMMGMANTGLANNTNWGGNPWMLTAGNAGNPFAALAPFSSLAGVQSLLAMAMAPWGGMSPQSGGVPWPWNLAGGMTGNLFGGNAQGWPSAGAFGGAWGMPSGGFGALANWPVVMGGAAKAAPSSPQLPWPWSMLGGMGGATTGASSGAAASSTRADDPMGFSQMMNFWGSMLPGSATSRAERETDAKPEPKAAAPDLAAFFPWMKLLK